MYLQGPVSTTIQISVVVRPENARMNIVSRSERSKGSSREILRKRIQDMIREYMLLLKMLIRTTFKMNMYMYTIASMTCFDDLNIRPLK